MAKRRTLNKRQLQRRARNVYSVIADVFGKAQLGERWSPNKIKGYQKKIVREATKQTTFSRNPTDRAYLKKHGEIGIGKKFLQQQPSQLTPGLATEFLHKWKVKTRESRAGHFVPHAAYYYLSMKQPKCGSAYKLAAKGAMKMLREKKLQKGIDRLNESLKLLGKMDSRDEQKLSFDLLAMCLADYAFKLEKRISLRHSGLYFLALLDAGKTVRQAERIVRQSAKTKKK